MIRFAAIMERALQCIDLVQLFVAAGQLLLLARLVRTVWHSERKVARYVRAPFAIRGQAIMAGLGALFVVWLFWVFFQPLTHTISLWFSVAVVPVTALAIAYAMGRFRTLATEALRHARNAPEFERVWVFKNYARIFRPRVEPLLAMIGDRSAQRALLTLCDEGYEVRGRPLRDLVEDRVRLLQSDALKHALELGFCPEDKRLHDAVRQEETAQREALWERILSRDPGAPVVGQAIRAILQEALARQDPRWSVRVQGGPTKRSVKQALRRLGNKLTAISDEVGLELDFQLDGPDSVNATMKRLARAPQTEALESEPTFVLELAIEEVAVDSVFARQRVREQQRSATRYGEDPDGSTATTQLKEVEIFYPSVTVAGRLLRNGMQEQTIRVSSSSGRAEFSSGQTLQQDQLSERAAALLFDGLLRGIGLQTDMEIQPASQTHTVS